MRKSSFLTFCFAFIPGAGEMYLGMMRKGAFIMLLFWGILGLSGFLQMGFLCAILPIIWFYSYFETFNLKQYPFEQLELMDQAFAKQLGERIFRKNYTGLLQKRHLYIGILLILTGSWLLFNYLVIPALEYFLPEDTAWYLYYFSNRIPTIVVAVGIIVFGIYLLRGKPVSKQEEYVEYGGKSDE